jgi:hypothetical protein
MGKFEVRTFSFVLPRGLWDRPGQDSGEDDEDGAPCFEKRQ